MFFTRARVDQLDACMRLIVTCFIENRTFTQLFPDRDTRADAIRENFRQDVEFCLIHGTVFIATERENPVSMLITLDFNKCLEMHKPEMDHLLGEIFSPYTKAKWEACPGTARYMMLICVHPALRARDLEHRLIDKMFQQFPEDWCVIEIDNTDYLQMLQEKGFLVHIEPDGAMHGVRPPIPEGIEILKCDLSAANLLWGYRRTFDNEIIPGAPRVGAYPTFNAWYEAYKHENVFIMRHWPYCIGVFYFDPDTQELEFSIHPEYRRKGYGKTLLRAAVSYMRGIGIQSAICNVPDNNAAALATINTLDCEMLSPGRYKVTL